MSGSKKTAGGGKAERPAPEKDAGKPDGAVDDGALEGVAGGAGPSPIYDNRPRLGPDDRGRDPGQH